MENRGNSNNDSGSSKSKIWCRCGHGLWEEKRVKCGQNKDKMYYACPIKRGAKCKNGFIQWCDAPVVDDGYFQPPSFKYPECECGAGVCRRVAVTLNHIVKCYFTCPIRQNHGSCGYVVWEEELLDNNSAVRQNCKRPLNGFVDGDSLLVKRWKRTRSMDSSVITTLMTISQAKLSQRKKTGLKKALPLSCLSRPISISQESFFQRHILVGGAADALGFCPMDWLGRLLYSCPLQSLKFPLSQPIFCSMFPSFNPRVIPDQESIPDGPCCFISLSQFPTPCGFSSLSQQTQLSTPCDFSSLSQQTQISTICDFSSLSQQTQLSTPFGFRSLTQQTQLSAPCDFSSFSQQTQISIICGFSNLTQQTQLSAPCDFSSLSQQTQISTICDSSSLSQQTQLSTPCDFSSLSQQTQLSNPCGFSSLSQQTQLSTPSDFSRLNQQTQIPTICGFSSLSQQTEPSTPYHTEFSSKDLSPKMSQGSERKLMSKAQRLRQLAFVAQKQLLMDLTALEPHEHEAMREAAEDALAMLDNLGVTDKQFCELIWDFINLSSLVARMTQTIENSPTPEEHNKCLEEEKARLDHIQIEYAKTEAMSKASDQRRQSLRKDISDLEAMLHEKQHQLKLCETESLMMEIELGDLKSSIIEAETALKARTEQTKVVKKILEEIQETQAKQIAAKSALKKATLGIEENIKKVSLV